MMRDDEFEVTVKRQELLRVMKANRENHRKVFLEAQEGFKQEVIAALERNLKEARAGKRIVQNLALIEPMDQTREYDRAIKMLEMSTSPTISISEARFSQYAMDDWGWKQQFVASTANYTNRGR